ncbi:MAG TPA: hypothetical protein VEL28_18980 [Candidatus Binatia bacterium]|nr:hypothetical protein [Candidatus Binatia bacterium]
MKKFGMMLAAVATALMLSASAADAGGWRGGHRGHWGGGHHWGGHRGHHGAAIALGITGAFLGGAALAHSYAYPRPYYGYGYGPGYYSYGPRYYYPAPVRRYYYPPPGYYPY